MLRPWDSLGKNLELKGSNVPKYSLDSERRTREVDASFFATGS